MKEALNERRIDIATSHLEDFLGGKLDGGYFLDIGCGSGIHSLAAHRLGAGKIVSFDYDPDSVRTTQAVCDHFANGAEWTISQGSILDEEFITALKPADVVYSWGVLHHTGGMWLAVDNAIRLIRPGGVFYLALYTYEMYPPPHTPEFWIEVKQKYNQSSSLKKRFMELWYFEKFVWAANRRAGRSTIKAIIDYSSSRGMSLYHDIKDWLGGWPMEFAKIEDVKTFCGERGLWLIKIKTGEANTEYLFQKE